MTFSEVAVPIATLIVGIVGTLIARPKTKADAAKAVAESAALDWARFHAEIARQDAKIAAMEDRLMRQDAEIENLKHDRDDRDDKLAVERKENRALIAKLSRIETRLGKIEALLKLHPLTPELKADLAKLDD